MALSEPERGNLDPKAHLRPFGDEMNLDNNAYETPLPPQKPIDSQQDSSASVNESAHRANSAVTASDPVIPPTNGIHLHPSPPADESNHSNPAADIPEPSEAAAIGQLDALAPEKPAPADVIAPENEAEIGAELGEPAPPVLQQPTSDVRHSVEPDSRIVANPQEGLDLDLQPKSTSLADDDLRTTDTTSQPAHTSAQSPPKTGTVDSPLTPAPPFAQDTSAVQNNDLEVADSKLTNGDHPSDASPQPAPLPALEQESVPEASIPEEGGSAVPESAQIPSQHDQSEDQIMSDAPASSKTGRAREDDEVEDAPATKRTKTEEEDSKDAFKVPDRPQIDTQMSSEAEKSDPSPMTKARQKHFQKALTNLKRNQIVRPFLAPVDPEALNIPTYFNVIKQPMDLRTLEENLRADKYQTVDEFLKEFHLIVQNSLTFNGPQHAVSQSALSMQEIFDKSVATLPGADVQATAPPKKKAADPMTIRAPPARRESRSSLPSSAKSPGSATSPKTFALGPEGVPLIRRDSTVDGRPKREIHKPAPKDLPYTNQKPKKKKFQWELKFCDFVLKEITKPKYYQYSQPFLAPVDPVALNIPNYLSIVKKPMDFGTMRQRLDRGEYENAKEFEADGRQVFKNCFSFNLEHDFVHTMGKKFESIFNEEWSKKREWLDENIPDSGQRSPASSEEEDSEENEEEEEEDEGQMEIVSKLQKQIAEMSKQVEMITSGAKKKTPPAANKKAAKPAKAQKKESKKATPAQPKPSKKAAAKPAAKERIPYVTYEQKQDISNRINSLSEAKMAQALTIIRNNMPNLQGVQEDELELDIDDLPNDVLYKLLQFVRKNVPRPDDSPGPVASASTAAPARKKNKPMSKTEQEARIAQVQSGLSAFQKGGSRTSLNDVQQSIENQSDDDDEDSESEEE